MASARLATIHAIINVFEESLRDLGYDAPARALEDWSVLVHGAMTGRARLFHGSEHIFQLADGVGAIETLAVLFHDIVYVQVDDGLPEPLAELVLPYIEYRDGAYCLAPIDFDEDETAQLVVDIFGFQIGQPLSPFSGLNEFLSAIVGAKKLATVLKRDDVARVVACIEGTIPFRGRDEDGLSPFDRLEARLRATRDRRGLALTDREIRKTVELAVVVSNKDVMNFASEQPEHFLDNTWMLLPETNPALRHPSVYNLRHYRVGIQKMEGFLSALDPTRVFNQFGDTPNEKEYARLEKAAARNLRIASDYLGIKLGTIVMLETIAQLTGGDVPVALFMGDVPFSDDESVRRLEDLLPKNGHSVSDDEFDSTIMSLLEVGRTSETEFDVKTSPLSAYVYRRIGHDGVRPIIDGAKRFLSGGCSSHAFLRLFPSSLLADICEGLAQMAWTRAESIRNLAAELTD